MIREISGLKMVKEGYRQAFYITDTYEILLNDIKKGTALSQHRHELAQFVYCLQGDFDLIIGTDRFRLLPGDAMVISSQADHSAEAAVDFMSIDYKFVTDVRDENVFRENVLKEKINNQAMGWEEAELGSARFLRIIGRLTSSAVVIPVETSKRYFLAVPKKILLKINETIWELYPMKLYEVVEKGGMAISFLTSEAEVLLWETEAV